MRRQRQPWLAAGLVATALLAAAPAQAAVLRYCDDAQPITPAQQDRLLRLAALVSDELASSGRTVALVARSGIDLKRFGQRYSHGGVSIKAHPGAAWSVRQLYYACAEGVPRIFDQGLPGFVLGVHDPDRAYLSVVLLPEPAQSRLQIRALDNRMALALLGSSYSANAHAFSTRHQNCNQWLAELLATAWGADPPPDAESASITAPNPRQRAQAWLAEQGFVPTVFEVGQRWLTALAQSIPWIYNDDHPAEDLAQARYRVSMPAAIETWVRQRWPDAERLEFCHNERHIVMRRGWKAMGDGCLAEAGDRVVPLQ